MKRILTYLSAYKKEAVLAPLFKLLEAVFELFVPLVMAQIIDIGIGTGDYAHVAKMGAILAALAIIGLSVSVTAQFFAAKAAVGTGTALRQALFDHIMDLDYTRIDRTGTSTLITRMTSDINQVQSGINMTLRLFLRSPIIVLGASIMAFTIDVRSALIFLAAVPLLTLVVALITKISLPLYRKVQGALDNVLLSTRENLTGARVLRAFRQEEAEKARFSDKNAALVALQMHVGRIGALMNPLTLIIVNGAVIYLIYTGALRVNAGILTQGQVVALINYMSQILVELIKLANLIVLMTKAAACAQRISDVLATENKEDDNPAPGAVANAPYLVFDRVSLTYAGAGAEALSDLSFTAEKGQTIGIIGGTGSGKTSLVNLLAGFYPATSGGIYLEGTNLRDTDPALLRRKVGIVPQKAVLFGGTVRSNLLWGNPDADDETLWRALRMAQAEEIVRGKEGQLDAEVAQGGRNFSGGQKQRHTIARALAADPEILILDDSASALDYLTESRLRAEIASLKETTVFIVSQRASSIMAADKILVLDDGHLAGMGTHRELLESCGIYREIYETQFETAGKEAAV